MLGVPRCSMVMEKVKRICARWTRSSEERTRRLRPRDHRTENIPCAGQIGHMKSKNAWVMNTAWTKEDDDGVMALGEG